MSGQSTRSRTRRRLSIPRLMVAVVATGAVAGGALFGVQWLSASAETTSKAWFAGYADVTATPSFAFESPTSAAGKNVVLSFIVSTPGDVCAPSWGTAYSLDQASASLDLDRRIARLQQQGGDIAVSFGGQANDELATDCTDVTKLASAYSTVIDRYNLTTIDIDIEGANLSDTAANQRRAEALALVQKERRNAGKELAVWLTLPVSPSGLDDSGQKAVSATLDKKLDIAGVNAMTMDYGSSLTPGTSELAGSTQALTATQRQLGILYSRAGIHLSDKTLWSKIGATPMIGQNDVQSEVLTLSAAKGLNAFARQHGLGRVSMWSLNRDVTCGSNYVALKVVSDSCSGVDQGSNRFADLLAKSITGKPFLSAAIVTTDEPVDAKQVADNPATSPYAIWSTSNAYLQGTKIVWHHNVYQAKWWTRGDLPDNPVLNGWQTPWLLVGPVMKGEKPIVVPTLPTGTYVEWSSVSPYDKGDRVLFDNVPYEAKWWNQAQSPEASSSDPDISPWVPLTVAQIKELLDGTE
ncbi:chitinase [Glaciihabitans sp. UYNi722]|uniref:chitinase n=1 Tax=Glaciihabitans sp. UYNi722 TaxID=3156344 RepID=UPI003394FC51